MASRIDEKTVDEIIALYVNDGISQKEIEAKTGIKSNTISAILIRHGYGKEYKGTGGYISKFEKKETPRSLYTEEQRKDEIIKAFINNGVTMTTIIKRFNLTNSEFLKIINEAGYGAMDCGVGGYGVEKVTSYNSNGITFDRDFKFGDIYYVNIGNGRRAPNVLIGSDYALKNYENVTTLSIKILDENSTNVKLNNYPHINGCVVCGNINVVRRDAIEDFACSLRTEDISKLKMKLSNGLGIRQADFEQADFEIYNPEKIVPKTGDVISYPHLYIEGNTMCYKYRNGVVVSPYEYNKMTERICVAMLTTQNISKSYQNTQFLLTTQIYDKNLKVVIQDIQQIDLTHIKLTEISVNETDIENIKKALAEFYEIPTETPQNIDVLTTERNIYKDILYKMLGD